MGNFRLMPWTRAISSLGIVWLAACVSQAAPPPRAVDLRCEYARNPVAIEVAQPRLSWVVEAGPGARHVRQAAYQVLVASDLARLAADDPDLWDSGKVASDQSVHVVYGGKPLAAGQACYWKVRLWDQAGQASADSGPARWGMGLLAASDWNARWIGYEAPSVSDAAMSAIPPKLLALEGQHWVWTHDAKPGSQPAGTSFFRKVIQVPADRTVTQAVFLLTADDGFQLFVNGQLAGQGSTWQKLVQIEVTERLQPGANAIAIEASNGGDSPSPAGAVGRLVIAFASGDPMTVPIDASWQTSRTAVERWNHVDAEVADWKPAGAVARFGDQPWGRIEFAVARLEPASCFRKAFAVRQPVRRAILFASALGLYELRLNGQAIDSDVLSPGWTDYRKRVHYFGYDVTARLRQGENALGATLGDGWYAGYLAFSGKRHYYGDKTRLRLQLQIEHADGSKETLGTDGTWKATTGPVRENDLLMGSVYDARLELPGWDAPGYADAGWHAATVDDSVQARLEAHPGTPIRRMEDVPAKTLTEPKPGVYVFDLGQNLVGWVRLRAKGQAGQKVVVRHAEMLNPDGTLYTVNLRAAKATDTYYLAGGSARAYEPSFTFHGFQYVEVTGLDYRPELADVTGVVVYSDLPQAGSFTCSEPLVNKLVLNALWGQKGNFLAFGDVAPHISVVGYGNTGWSDAGPVCVWRMYEMYGDRRILAEHYQALVRHLDFLAKTSQNLVRGTGAYGDWLRLAGPQHSEAIGTAYYFYAAQLMTSTAEALGRPDDAAQFRKLAADIRTTFAARFIQPDGQIRDAKNETGQTFYALAFGLDLVPGERKSQVAAHFLASLRQQDDHLATGFLGTPMVLAALQKSGRPELAYKLVLNRTYPSWLQQVIWGSTTMWERWDGWTHDKGFQSPAMNSFNHYAYGASATGCTPR